MLVIALLVGGIKLIAIQTVQAGQLSADAAKQRTTRLTVPAERGEILDRNGAPMAFSVEAKALVANPRQITASQGRHAADRKAEIASALAQLVDANPATVLSALNSDRSYVMLAPLVDPGKARAIRQRFPEIGEQEREARQYPGGALASNIIGSATWSQQDGKLHGLVGLESSQDNMLAGTDGYRIVDTAEGSNTVIPGSTRSEQPATPGSNLQLTVDSDLQYTVQRELTDYVTRTGAKDGSVVVLDAKTAEVLALANDRTFDPNDVGAATKPQLGNPALTTPYEPGSVNKIVTMAAALEYGVANPQTVLSVPDNIKIADRTIHDAWNHSVQQFTLTGVLAKSSNVGTLMTALKVGPDRFADMLARFGLGVRTDVGLPGESAGRVPPRETWSGSTFGNLPIGQGLSMTVLQMAGMYQAIANNGVRVPPRIVAATVAPDGTRQPEPRPEGVQVVSAQTAQTLRGMLTAVTQDAHGQRGTGTAAALDGYQIAGKTGTAQQINPSCGCYASRTYWVTFAGMLPANDPRYVVGIMLDAPSDGSEAGQTAAPLFHDIAAFIAQRDRIPVSTESRPVVPLTVP